MTPREPSPQPPPGQSGSAVESSTVQVLVANEGNRTAICSMLSETFDVDTSPSIRDADLYLIEDRLLSKYREQLREHVTRNHPTFCPVVIIQREHSRPIVDQTDTHESDGETPLLVDEFVTAPIQKQLLVSRLRSLLVRRQQSLELQEQVETLERQERELRRFERAVEDGGTATAITDLDGVIEYANSAFEEVTGYPAQDAIGHPLERFLADDSQQAIDASFWRTVAEQSAWEGELLIERKHRGRRITDTSITPIRDDDGTNEGFVVVMPDITPRIEQAQLLRDREQELDLLRQILSRYLRHNLRNDLNVVLGYAELLEGTLPEADARHATEIRETAERLMKRSETAQKYSSLIAQESDLASHNVAAIVEEIVAEARTQYPAVEIDVDTPEECAVLARDGIREAIGELIDNAARHNTAESPWVRVTVTDGEGIQVVIEDNGPGISQLELETLDQGSETALRHSQGVGLWLSKWVIERSDGHLSFDTTAGGTRVTVAFPPVEHAGANGVAMSNLKAREQRLQTIMQRMTDAVLEVDAGWNITYVDSRAEDILGVDADAIYGRSFWEVFSAARDTRFETVYREVMQSRSATRVEEYYSGIDGWLAVYAYPDFDGGLSFYFRDVTERKDRERRLEQAHSRMELALSVTDAAVWEWESDTDTFTFHPRRHPVLETTVRSVEDFIDEIHPADRSRVRDAFETAVETGSPYDVEYRVQREGNVRWATAYGEPQYDDSGTVDRMIGVVRESTDRKAREAELELKSKAMDEAPTGITITGPPGDDVPMIYTNDYFKRLTGYADAQILGRNCRFLQGEHTDPEQVAKLREAVEAGEPETVELRNYRRDGTEFWNRVSIAPIRTDGTEITHFVGFQQDVTAGKVAEEYRQRIYQITSATAHSAAHKIDQLLALGRELLGMENAHVTEIDRSRQRHTIEYASGSTLITSGLVSDLSESFCRRTIETDDIVDVSDSTSADSEFGSPIAEIGCYVGTKLVVGDEFFGTVCFVDRNPRSEPVSDPEKALVDLIGRWISQLLQSKREREAREEILSRMTDALFSVDEEWRVTHVNDTAREAFTTAMGASQSREELVGRSLWEAFPELVGTVFEDKYREAMESQESVAFRACYDPADTWFDVRAYPSNSGLSVYFRDVTEQAEHQAEIRAREQTLREVYEVISDTSRSFDEQVERLLAIGTDAIGVEYGSLSRVDDDRYVFEVVDAPAGTIAQGDVVSLSATNCEQAVLTEETVVIGDVGTDPELSQKAGHAEWGITCYLGTPVFVDGEVYGTFCFYSEAARQEPFSEWEVTLVDLIGKWISTELDRQRTEQRLRQQNDRLEQFASVVSHDLRNPLNVAEGHLELAQQACQTDHHADISYALDRIAVLIDDVLTLARNGDEIDELEPVSLSALADSCWETVDTRDATLVVEGDLTITADRSRLQQLLENLFRNAIEHGGEDVTITVGSIDGGFYVSDDGPGIPDDERTEIFELGYSTAESGTGLGLSIVKRVAEAHGWEITVTEGAAGGARFEVSA